VPSQSKITAFAGNDSQAYLAHACGRHLGRVLDWTVGVFEATGKWGDEPTSTRAKLFQEAGQEDRGGGALLHRRRRPVRDPRGSAVKFYTEDDKRRTGRRDGSRPERCRQAARPDVTGQSEGRQ
jgi:hypothetical protein